MAPKKLTKKKNNNKKSASTEASNVKTANSPSNQDGGVNTARATRSQSNLASNKRSSTSQAKSPKAKKPKANESTRKGAANASAKFQEDGQEMQFVVHAHESRGDFGDTSHDETYLGSQVSNTNASATASDSDLNSDRSSDEEDSASDSHSEGEIDSDSESEQKVKSTRASTPGRRTSAVGEALHKVQRIVSKKGYIEAKTLEQLTGDLDIGAPPAARYLGTKTQSKPKRSSGAGDREATGRPSGKSAATGRTGKIKMHFDKPTRQVNWADPEAESDITVYKNAVRNKINHYRSSSSSDDLNVHDFRQMTNTNQHSIEMDVEQSNMPSQFISEIRRHYEQQQRRKSEPERRQSAPPNEQRDYDDYGYDDEEPHCSWQQGGGRPHQSIAEVKADELIRDAEASKARIYGTPGMYKDQIDVQNEFVHSAMVDESYMLVAAHIDDTTVSRIEQGKYVDFAKLLARDKLMEEAGPEYKLIIKGGNSIYVPASEGTTISSFNRWEQAFRVFSDIYTRVNPKRAAELIQYNHVIHSISLTYAWHNVYAYDVDFRIHMGKHPARSWGIILQMSWSFRLQDKLRQVEGNFGNNRPQHH